MNKEAMIVKMNEYLTEMTEEKVKSLLDFCSVMQTPSAEQSCEPEQEQNQNNEEHQTLIANQNDLFTKIEQAKIPPRYDIKIKEILAIDARNGQIGRCFPDYAFGVCSDYFSLGFLRGMRCAKANSRRKCTTHHT